ncbi:MAG TPA: hypothetical protein VJG13_08155, partial [Thermoanaerobaculia bacterium]|nr:hypothetical protein [Thermoanaerobaculia bacterium]
NVTLTGVVVSDNRGVAVSCPRTTLGAGERMVCTASGIVAAGQYGNIGTVTGNTSEGSPVADSDPSHYFGVPFIVAEPSIAIEKLTNGQDADLPLGPTLSEGSPVSWTYVVTNNGAVDLTAVSVTDSDPAVTVICPKAALAIGESMVCTASGTAVQGQYSNLGSASGLGAGETVSASDPSHYFGLPPIITDFPAIEIEKLTNGYDADGVASAPHLIHGHPVIWTYVVTNTGNVVLANVTVTDDQGVAVSCPKTTLEPGEQMICTGSGSAVASEVCYANVGTAKGTPPVGDDVTDSDPSHYCAEEVPGEPAIDLEKYTNGYDADLAPGPALTVGDNVQWVYVVTNTGDVTLTGVTVSDDQGVAITCDGVTQPFVLDPGEQVICFANGAAVTGQYANLGTAEGTPQGGGDPVSDTDPSHYFGEEAGGDQGCTPGYWKNHTDSWPPTGYSPSQAVDGVFASVNTHFPTLGDATLLEALSFAGGSGAEGAAEILLRAAVAALLNAAHPGVAYPRTLASVIADVNAALATGSRDVMLTLAASLDADNNLGCPLH